MPENSKYPGESEASYKKRMAIKRRTTEQKKNSKRMRNAQASRDQSRDAYAQHGMSEEDHRKQYNELESNTAKHLADVAKKKALKKKMGSRTVQSKIPETQAERDRLGDTYKGSQTSMESPSQDEIKKEALHRKSRLKVTKRRKKYWNGNAPPHDKKAIANRIKNSK